jgi:tol-pal system protein YbgF
MRKLLLATSNKLQLCLVAGLLSSTVVAQGTGSVVESQAFTPGQSQSRQFQFESSAENPPLTNNDGMSLLLDQNRQLQAELQALRAMVEEQSNEIRKLQRDSLSRYSNVDERLSSLESAAANSTTTANSAAGTNLNAEDLLVLSRPNARPPVVQGADTPAARDPDASAVGRVRVRATLEPAVLSEQQLYQMAYDSAINQEFERSVAEFDQYLSIYPQGRFVVNAHYWKGQAYYYLARYTEAREAYEIIMNQYDATEPKYPDAMYGLAQAYEGLGNIPQARQLLLDVKKKFPNTGAANLADTRLLSLD